MAYDATKPLDDGYLAEAPAELRELHRALKEDKIVNAGMLNGYTQGNESGKIPLNNGTLNTNLNADMLDGHDSAYFSASTHGHNGATTSADGFMTTTQVTKLNGIATGAEVNQNAFSNVTVGSSTIQADGKTDTLTLAAGTGITLTADTTNDKVTIAVTANTYAAASHTHNYAGSSSAGGAANSLLNFTSGTNGVAEHDANKITTNGLWYYSSNGPATSLGASVNDGALYSQAWSASWVAQIAQDYRNGNLFVRGRNNGTWKAWQAVLTKNSSLNAAKLTGTVPSGCYTNTTYSGATASANGLVTTGAQTWAGAKTISNSSDTGWGVTYGSGDSAQTVRFMVGSGHVNRGLYDTRLNKWIMHCDNSKCYVGGFSIEKSVPSDAKFTDTVYTHPTSAGNKHIPAGGSSGQILRWSAAGTAAWGADSNTTYSAGHGLALSSTTFRLAVPYCTCATAASTAAKVASVSSGTFALNAGAMAMVKMNNSNTNQSGCTLNIGSTGAKTVYGSNLAGYCLVYYDGSAYRVISNGANSQSKYNPSCSDCADEA